MAALREPLRTMCVVLDFRNNTMDQVIDRVLEMDKHSSFMSLGALHRALPKEEDLRFRHALQCTCLNSGHSTVDCTMRTQCMICHSRAHTTDRCEYNLLNRQAAPVRHIEPRHGQESEEERFERDNRYRPERGDRYIDRRRDDYEHDRDDRRKEGYNRDRYEQDYSPDYD